MNIFKNILIIGLLVFFWLVSGALANLKLEQLEREGHISFGPLPDYERKNYSFSETNISYLIKYPMNRISELSKNDFQDILLYALDEKDRENLRPHLPMILSKSEEYQVDPLWVLSIIMVESRFASNAVSHKNAQGLMQIRPDTALHLYQILGRNREAKQNDIQLFDEDENVNIGVFYLKKLLQNFRLNYRHATVAYNVGPNKLKNLLLFDEIIISENDYLVNVEKSYLKFKNFLELSFSKIPKDYTKTYIVEGQGLKLEDVIYSQLGLDKLPSTTSENLAKVSNL
jgi:soluble lytic murein transglycosylase-like protein